MNRVDFADAQAVQGSANGTVTIYHGGVPLGKATPSKGQFRFEFPPHIRDGAEHSLTLQLDDGSPLDGSPAIVQARDESARLPFVPSDWTGCRALVLAPHPDDETIGCGGSVALHAECDDHVTVLFLTDGGAAGDPEVRKAEARKACQALGAQTVLFWDYPDRHLPSEGEAVERLLALLEKEKPEVLYCPSPWEVHPDHLAACRLGSAALRRYAQSIDVLYYELGNPLQPNSLVDVSGVFEKKRHAISQHQSQLALAPYDRYMESFACLRSYTVAGTSGATHCEAFYHIQSRELALRPLDIVPATLPFVLAKPAPEMVSVVVRLSRRRELATNALASLAAQTYRPLQVVLIETIPDSLGKLELAGFARSFTLDTVETDRPLGRSEALNRGFEAATGRYVGLLDDDDLIHPEHLSKLARFLSVTGESFAYSDCQRVHYEWADTGFKEGLTESPFHGRDYDRDALYFSNFIPSMTPLFCRELVEAVGGCDEQLEALEDWDLWLRMAERVPLRHLPGVTATYRVFGERDYDFQALTLAVYEKHSEYWNVKNLAQATWPGIERLEEENRRLKEENHRQKARLERISLRRLWRWLRKRGLPWSQ
jgi:LmbE family N-acetylglucosaminyl deacetylase/glycosyltransferase involved in cell wall biosynthesis